MEREVLEVLDISQSLHSMLNSAPSTYNVAKLVVMDKKGGIESIYLEKPGCVIGKGSVIKLNCTSSGTSAKNGVYREVQVVHLEKYSVNKEMVMELYNKMPRDDGVEKTTNRGQKR